MAGFLNVDKIVSNMMYTQAKEDSLKPNVSQEPKSKEFAKLMNTMLNDKLEGPENNINNRNAGIDALG
jgi:hypothetical protein